MSRARPRRCLPGVGTRLAAAGLSMFSLAAFPVALLFLGSADLGQPASLRLAALPPDPDLGRLLWERAPDLAAARARVATARAQIVRAEALPNPTLDLSWNTIPVGETNPPGLSNSLANVPSYAVGLTQPFEMPYSRATVDWERPSRTTAVMINRALDIAEPADPTVSLLWFGRPRRTSFAVPEG